MGRTLIKNVGQLLTLAGSGPRRGSEMRDLGIIENGAILVDGEVIEEVGQTASLEQMVQGSVKTIDARGKIAMPGFVDSHTHLVYAGSREEEFELRLEGVDYAEITRRGGGIMSTVRATREASEDELFATGMERLDRLMRCGTTTVEIKSGYGLDVDSELKQLRVIRRLAESHRLDVVSTFLGAHSIPEGYSAREYKDVVVGKMMEAVASSGLAEFCDVFCEDGFFGYQESKEILREARRRGLKLKLHADELGSSGGSELAGEMEAVSADHLVYPSEKGLESMRKGGVIAVLLPGTVFMLDLKDRPPTGRFRDLGIPIALASDMNPGTCVIESMQVIAGLACLLLKMSPAEVLVACTINAAYALDRGDSIGSIEAGKQADILLFDVPNYKYLVYYFTTGHLTHVMKKGELLFSRNS